MFLLAHFNFHVSHSKLFHFSIYLQSKDTCMRALIIFRDFCFKPLMLKYITPFPKLSENKQMKALWFCFVVVVVVILLLLPLVQIAYNNTCILKLFFSLPFIFQNSINWCGLDQLLKIPLYLLLNFQQSSTALIDWYYGYMVLLHNPSSYEIRFSIKNKSFSRIKLWFCEQDSCAGINIDAKLMKLPSEIALFDLHSPGIT